MGLLREVEARDLDALYAHWIDPEAIRMAAFTPADPSDRAAFDARWAKLCGDPSITVRVIEHEGEVVGHIGSWSHEGQREVTYWIARAHWGRGLATAALRELLREETTRPMFAAAAADNAGSLRVLEKCGFRRVGTGRGFANGRGAEVDEVLLRLDG